MLVKDQPWRRHYSAGIGGKGRLFDVDNYLRGFDSIDQARAELSIREQQLFDKALRSDDPAMVVKAMSKLSTTAKDHGFDTGNSPYSGKSLLVDPFGMNNQGGYLAKSLFTDSRTLRNMGKTPFIKSIVETRVEQVATFARYSEHYTEIGWIVEKKDQKKGASVDTVEVDRIREFILNTGVDENRWVKDNFNKFLRKITKDTLELDAMTFEVVRKKNGDLFEFFATDGGTFYYADPREQEEMGEEVNGYFPTYVQVYQGSVYNEYYPWELAYGIRNPSSDIWRNGYGRSELEDLVQIVTWQLYGMQYTGAFFSKGSAPKGILKIQGNINERRLQEFKQQWQAQVQGIKNAWKTPIMEADKMEWVDLQKTNRDMEFNNWISFLVKVSCAIYKIDPSEIGMPMGEGSDGGNSQGLHGDATKEKVLFSKEKGLRPLLVMIEEQINTYVVGQLNPEYRFSFTGTSFEDPKARLEDDIKKVGNFLTIDEIRKKYNVDELGEKNGGDLILNPVWWQAKAQAQQGGEESNDYMRDEYGGEEENPYESNWMNQGENPFLKSINEATETLIEQFK